MDEKKINQLLENIEIFMESTAKNNERILEELNGIKNEPKTAQILAESEKTVKRLSDEISGLILAEKRLVEGFKPVVEVRQYSVNVKEPLWWIIGAVFVMVACIFVSYSLYDSKEQYKQESELKDWNHMKYKYLELFGDPQTRRSLKEFNADYGKNWKTYDQQIIKRERELDEAAKAAKEAQLKATEAKKLQQRADSLRNSH